MGVQCRITVYAREEDDALVAMDSAFARIAAIEQCMSDYRPTSDIRLLAHAAPEWRPLSPDLRLVVRTSAALSRASDGLFDISIGPLVALWRESRRQSTLPDPQSLLAARALVNWRNIEESPDGTLIRCRVPGMQLDLGGVAKGFAAHEAVKHLRSLGYSSALVALSGDVAAGDPPPGTSGWKVAVSHDGNGVLGYVLLANECCSTSGDAEQVIRISGIAYSHIVDPRTGLGCTYPGAVTVVGPDGATVDALASAIRLLADQVPRAKQVMAGFSGYSGLLSVPAGESGQSVTHELNTFPVLGAD